MRQHVSEWTWNQHLDLNWFCPILRDTNLDTKWSCQQIILEVGDDHRLQTGEIWLVGTYKPVEFEK